MDWLTDRTSFLIAVIVYGVSMVYSVFLWRRGFRQDNRFNYFVLLCGFAFHTMAVLKRGFSTGQCPVHNLYEAIVFLEWTIVVIYLGVGLWSRLRFLGAFASPGLFALGIFALFPSLDPPHGPQPQFGAGLVTLHAALILLAYGAFGLGSVAGFMYLTQEHNLKVHKLQAILSRMPPIERLEKITGLLLTVGFVLLTAGLSLTPFLLDQPYLTYLRKDPKVAWSLVIWFVYLLLLVTRWRRQQGGRRFAWGAVGVFAFLLLTFWGVNLISPAHTP